MTAELLRVPADDVRDTTEIGRFLRRLEDERGLRFADYAELHRWSVTDLEGFWTFVRDFFGVRFATPADTVLESRTMPGARWFPGATLNYAEHALRGAGAEDHETAVVAHSQTREPTELTWGELREEVARARAGLRRLGVGRGDRVVAYLPNIPEAVVGFLAAASIGAVWSSCSPDFGAASVIDRFAQIEPKVLLAVDGYRYGGKDFDRRDTVAALQEAMPSLVASI